MPKGQFLTPSPWFNLLLTPEAIRYPRRFAALLPIAFRAEPGWDVCAIKDIPTWAFHGALDAIPDDGFTYHVPFEGRHTAKSVFPSPS